MIQLLWIHNKTLARPREESLSSSDAPKIDYFWGIPEAQIPKPLRDMLVPIHTIYTYTYRRHNSCMGHNTGMVIFTNNI